MYKFFISNKILEILPDNLKKKLIYFSLLLFLASLFELCGLSLIIPIAHKIFVLDTSFQLSSKFKFLEFFLNSTEFLIATFFFLLLLKNIFLIKIFKNVYKFLFKTEEKISNNLLQNYLKKNYEYFVNQNSSKLVNNLTLEVLKINDAIIAYLTLVGELFFLSGLIILFGLINFQFTISILIILILFLFSYIFYFRKKIIKIGTEMIKLNDHRFKNLKEIFSNIQNIKVLTKENFFFKKYADIYNKSIDLRIKNQIIQMLPRLLVEIFIILLLIVIYLLFSSLETNIKNFIPELGFLVLCLLRIIPSINKIINSIQKLNFSEKTFDNFKKILNNNEVKNDCIKENKYVNFLSKDENFQNIEIKNLFFRYKNKIILDKTNIKFQVGKIYGIFGESGSGKSTFLNILLGLLKVESADLKIDNDSCKFENQFFSINKKIGFVSQNQTILDDTIKNNIAFGIENISIDENKIYETCEKIKLSNFIENLPNNINSKVGEWGSKISGGQIQRLLIGRALYNNPKILILDEPTSSLDGDLEVAIIKTLIELKKDKIIIFVTHNFNNKNYFDINYKLSNSKFEQF